MLERLRYAICIHKSAVDSGKLSVNHRRTQIKNCSQQFAFTIHFNNAKNPKKFENFHRIPKNLMSFKLSISLNLRFPETKTSSFANRMLNV